MSFIYSINLSPLVTVEEDPMSYRKARPTLPKSELQDGVWYEGSCRNSKQARWNASKNCFEYVRTKFTFKFVEEINHPADFTGFDVFFAQRAIADSEVTEPIPIVSKPSTQSDPT